MDGTASGKQPAGVNVAGHAARPAFLVLVLLLAASPAPAQTPGQASFRILQRGVSIGTVEVSVSSDDEGWRIRSTDQIDGASNVTVKQFDARYTGQWRARFLTVERVARRESTVVHVAIGRGSTAHTDIVTEGEARWRSHSVSPDTVFLPDHAYGAFEAVAARLHASGQRAEVPLLIAPDGEQRAVVVAWEIMSVDTRAGALRVARHTLMVIGTVPKLLHVWEVRGRLLRVDVPSDGISVIRADVIGP